MTTIIHFSTNRAVRFLSSPERMIGDDMAFLDWLVIALYCVAVLAIGLLLKKRADKSTDSFFLSSRSLPWWLAGTSMVATSFASDTPLMVTGLVRVKGVAGNWSWWCFGFSHVLAIFFFSKLWRRAGVLTEVELCEQRYSGKSAAVLRGSKAVYFGVILNCAVIGAWPLNGLVKVMNVSTGWDKSTAIFVCSGIALTYSIFSGFWGVVVTDLIQFAIAMTGSIILAVLAIQHPSVGGLSGLRDHFAQTQTLDFLPTGDSSILMWIFGFIFVQWIAFKNSDGGGVIVQRMLACRDEKESLKATIWFSVAHYILRAWPWILVALASIIILPQVTGPDGTMDHESAYPMLMMKLLPSGLRGMMVAAFLAAFMSTVDTHLNWGGSYLVNDLYRRFIKKNEDEKHYMLISRLITLLLMGMSIAVAYNVTSIFESFLFIIKLTSGVGVIYLLRWFWWRVNAWTELTAMIVSSIMTLLAPKMLAYFGVFGRTYQLLVIVGYSVYISILITLLTEPVNRQVLIAFYKKVMPPGPGWNTIAEEAGSSAGAPSLVPGLINWAIGVVALYSGLFGVGAIFLKGWGQAFLPLLLSVLAGALVWRRRDLG